MLKFFLIVAALGAGIHFGSSYMLSQDFEKYADTSKASWTCHFENLIGNMHVVMSNYEKGYYRFSHTLARCPETNMAEVAEFEVAHCLEGMVQRIPAAAAYEAFAKKYPGTKRARNALRSAQILRGF